MNRKQIISYWVVFVLLFFVSNSFAILDTIVLQDGVNEYFGTKDACLRGNGYDNYLNVGSC